MNRSPLGGDAATAHQSALTPPLALGPFEVTRLLAVGGMSEIYLARAAALGKQVVIKLLTPGALAAADLLLRFRREARIMKQLNHPHILPLLAEGVVQGFPYLVLPYVEDGDLSRYMASRAARPAGLMEVFAQTCEALSYAHHYGVIHRDIKPSNLLIGRAPAPPYGPFVYLTDFGISRLTFEHGEELTRSGQSMGTLSYMSPEQQMDAKHIDHRTDLYSLGAVMYAAFTGSRPVGRFHPPSELIPAFPADLEAVILRCLEVRLDRRYASAEQLREDLLRLDARRFQDLLRRLPRKEPAGGEARPRTSLTVSDAVCLPSREPAAAAGVAGGADGRVQELLAGLQSAVGTRRLQAARALESLAAERVLPELLAFLTAAGGDARLAAIPVLGALGSADALPFLESALDDPLLCGEAARALGKLASSAAVPRLVALAESSSPQAALAIEPLASIGDPRGAAAIAHLLGQAKGVARLRALRALVAFRIYPPDLELVGLQAALADPDAQIALLARQVLGRIQRAT
ncbi:MAG: protein kinase [Candidatus Schekmanbacteria bacterium]|nr:protein kinase [Candidatus Schekmanbacteria bacterium]